MKKESKSNKLRGSNPIISYVNSYLIKSGYVKVPKDRIVVAQSFNKPLFSVKYPMGKGIYGTEVTCDYLIYHPILHKNYLALDIIWQSTGGTVDEKYPYFVSNIKKCYKAETIIVIAGGGYREGAEAWLRSKIGGKLQNVFNLKQFKEWVKEGNL